MNVTLHTNHGDIVVTLFPDHAPKTVENFVGLATGEKEYKDDAGRTQTRRRSTTAWSSTGSSRAS